MAKLVCAKGHALGLVHMIGGRPVAAMNQKAKRSPEDVDAVEKRWEARYGVRLISMSRKMRLVDLLDETDPSVPTPILRGECACRPALCR